MSTEKNKAKEKILVIKLGALGDFIQASGPMKAIRGHHIDAHITLLTTKPYANLGKKCGYFDDIWVDTKPRLFDLKSWRALRQRLKNGAFKRVYDLQNNDRTSFYLRLLPKKTEWVGAAKGASHRNSSPDRTKGSSFDGHAQTLKIGGIDTVEIDDLSWMHGHIEQFDLKRPYVLIAGGSAPDRKEKRWSAEKYGRLARMLHGLGFQPVLLGTMAELDVNLAIRKICPQVLDLTAKTSLNDIPALAREAAAAIGNDTGPMHMIAPTGCPSCVIFSRHSNPKRHAPLGNNVTIIYREELSTLEPEDIFKTLDLTPEHDILKKTVH